MKNLAMALDAGTPENRNLITLFLSNKNWAYWHWIDDFWIVQVPDNYTPKGLYDELIESTGLGLSTILTFDLNNHVNFWGNNKQEAWRWLEAIGSAN